MRRALRWMLGLVLVLAGLACALVFWAHRQDEALSPVLQQAASIDPAVLARGAYLARAGNCMGCHTRQDAAPWSGGRVISTPFGTLYSSNLTPDEGSGLGRWSAQDFWRALHHGRSRDGRLLYPAFPYPDYTLVTPEDAFALYSYLHSLAPVARPPEPHALAFPYNTQAALTLWRALFFRPAQFESAPDRPAQWNRGAYLVRGLAHCGACHTPHNAWGAPRLGKELTGGVIPGQQWFAPSLRSTREAGLNAWPEEEALALLQAGRSAHAGVSGPMASVVADGLQYLEDADVRAMLAYLRSLSPQESAPPAHAPPTARVFAAGERLYADACAQCHGAQGEGLSRAFPALAANRAVLLDDPMNLVRLVLQGGYLPVTQDNPRPYGMPPFAHQLSDAQIAAVLSYIRNAWGNQASRVDTIDVHRVRERREPD